MPVVDRDAGSEVDDSEDDADEGTAFSLGSPEPVGAALLDAAENGPSEVELRADAMVLDADEAKLRIESLADRLMLDTDEAEPLEDTPLGSGLLDADKEAIEFALLEEVTTAASAMGLLLDKALLDAEEEATF